MDPYEMLGNTVVREAIGADSGFGLPFLVDAGSELAKKGVSSYEASQQSSKDAAATQAQLTKAIAADANWAQAEALLTVATASKDASRIAPAQALQSSAMAASLSAGAGLSGDAVTKRTAAAQKAADQAAQDALANPKDATKQATMQAWQKVIGGISGGGGGALDAGGKGKGGGKAGKGASSGGSWLTAQVGPLPVWGWGVATIGVVGGGWLLLKLFRR